MLLVFVLVLAWGISMPLFSPTPSTLPIDLGSAGPPIVIAFALPGDSSVTEGSDYELLARLEEKTGLKYKLVVSASPVSSLDAIGTGRAHIAWLDTFSYIVARKRYEVQIGLVTVRDGSDHFNSHIIANRAAGIRTLGDLKGKTFCFVDRISPAGYVVPRIILQANGIDPEEDFKRVINAGSDANVAAAVYKGDCDAGAAVAHARTAIQKDFPDVMERVVVVDVSPDIPNDTVAFVKDFPADKRERIVQALLDIVSMEDGKRFLALHSADGFVKRDDSFYNRFRDLLTKAGVDIMRYIAK
jgi:phosphonate transport system substrate-binding protein